MEATVTQGPPGIYVLTSALATSKKEADAKIAAAQAHLDEDASPHRLRRERAARLAEELRAEHARCTTNVSASLDGTDAAALVAAVGAELATKAALDLAQARAEALADTERRLFAGRVNALNARRRTANRLANELTEAVRELWQSDDRHRDARAERLLDEIKTLALNA